jgi:hypothetical protein
VGGGGDHAVDRAGLVGAEAHAELVFEDAQRLAAFDGAAGGEGQQQRFGAGGLARGGIGLLVEFGKALFERGDFGRGGGKRGIACGAVGGDGNRGGGGGLTGGAGQPLPSRS